MTRRTPEDVVVDEIFAVRDKLERVADRIEKAGMTEARVPGSRSGNVTTTLGFQLSGITSQVNDLLKNVIALKEAP